MNLFPHWGNCKEELQEFKNRICSLERQIDAYMKDLQEVTCKLRQVTLESQKINCTECVRTSQEDEQNIDQQPTSVVE